MSSSHGRSGQWHPVEQIVAEVTAPFQKLINSGIKTTKNAWLKYFDLINTHEQNLQLKNEIFFLKEENFRYKELVYTYQRLQKLLKFTDTINNSMLSAQVIGSDPSGVFKSVIINKGESSGLTINMPVINADGVVGKIVSVSKNYSKVLLIIDLNSAVDCILQRSRDSGIVKGLSNANNQCEMDYVQKTSDVVVGDMVITSGVGGVYPKGIPVGEVIDVQEPSDKFFKYVTIAPSVNFSKLEELLVILVEDPLADQTKEKD
jgi:rod shape-determining protein MreC